MPRVKLRRLAKTAHRRYLTCPVRMFSRCVCSQPAGTAGPLTKTAKVPTAVFPVFPRARLGARRSLILATTRPDAKAQPRLESAPGLRRCRVSAGPIETCRKATSGDRRFWAAETFLAKMTASAPDLNQVARAARYGWDGKVTIPRRLLAGSAARLSQRIYDRRPYLIPVPTTRFDRRRSLGRRLSELDL